MVNAPTCSMGTVRLIAGRFGAAAGLEVWTGDAWVPLRGVRHVANVLPAAEPVLHHISAVVTGVLPATARAMEGP